MQIPKLLHWNKKKKSKTKTKAEEQHLGRVAAIGCIVCSRQALVHHIRTGMGMSQRATHYQTIPLCYNHHQGSDGIHVIGTRTWQKLYGTEIELLASVYRILVRLYPDHYTLTGPVA